MTPFNAPHSRCIGLLFHTGFKNLWLALFVIALPAAVAGQEGRPALKAETVEDARVLQAIHDSLPRDIDGWTIDRETEGEGTKHFHDSGEAVRYPFHHDYRIDYAIDPQSSLAVQMRDDLARGQLAPEDVDGASHVTIAVSVNQFDVTGRSNAAVDARPRAPFDVSLWGTRGAQLLLGPWRLVRNQTTADGAEYDVRATADMTRSMGDVQTIAIRITAPSAVRERFLAKMDTAALTALLGASPLQQRAVRNTAAAIDAPLTPAPAGINEFRYTVAGDDFPAQTVSIRPSATNQQAYLRNNHPDPQVQENAVTRLLVQEDNDTVRRTPYPLADVTIPFIRRTGTFAVTANDEADGQIGTFMAAIGCWSGCEWGFHPGRIEVTVTRYDRVNGFIEGTFSGTAIAVFRENQTIDDHRNLAVTISDGHFRIRRKADRY